MLQSYVTYGTLPDGRIHESELKVLK
jgi:hypothetical protein